MRTRSRAAALAALLLATTIAPTAALAADGPPPPGTGTRVLARVHTDAVSTFLTDGTLELATRADVPEGNGTRLDPADVRFHVDDASLVTLPAGFDFIGPAGSSVWLAPESDPTGPGGYTQLWPGFATDAVPAGALVDDRTTFTLTDIDGPGDLELYTGGGTTPLTRLWSSDDGVDTFTTGRTHMHASWAFTAAGAYRLDVRADAVTSAGTPVSATGTYTFVVGDLPAPVATGTTLAVSTPSARAGDTVTLAADVTPADAAGWVEFLDGTTTLGHAAVVDGGATLDVTTLPLGERSLTARFAPAVLDDHATSTSSTQVVTVTQEPGGELFGIGGWRSSWTAGDAVHLHVVGVTPAEGQHLGWRIRAGEGATEYLTGLDADFVREATTALDGVQIAAVLRGPVDGRQTVLQQTPWSTFVVTGDDVGSGSPVTLDGLADEYRTGDPVVVTAQHAPLTADRSYRWVGRPLPYGQTWDPLWENQAPSGGNPFTIDTAVLKNYEVALQVVAGDTVVGQSPAISPVVTDRELLLSGARSVYRDGDTLRLTSELYPARDGLSYQWGLRPSRFLFEPFDGETGTSLEMTVTAAMDGTTVGLRVTDASTGALVGERSVSVRVTSAAAGEQLVLLDALADHYHQGNVVALRATADPIASDTDTYRWEWRRPDQAQWHDLPGATSSSHDLVAEQALDGTLVRATLLDATGTVLATSEDVVVHVDDHGAPPRQKVAVTGLQAGYAPGEQVTLDALVEPASVLDRWEWYVQRPGEDTPALLEDTTASRLTFDARADLDGAALLARLTFDDGRAYVESAPVLLHVDPTAGPEPTGPGGPEPTDPPSPTDPGGPEPTDPAGTRPATAPAPRTGAELDGVAAGGVTPSTATVRQGQVVTLALGARHAGAWTAAWLFSAPTLLGGDWLQADAQGTVTVRVPVDAPVGPHRLAVFAADGTLVGWAAVEVLAATGAQPTDRLATTGGTPGPLLALAAVALLGAGAVLVAARRRAHPGA